MTPMKTSLAYSGRFSRINDAECKERSTLSSGNFIQIQILGRRKKKRLIETLIKRFLEIK